MLSLAILLSAFAIPYIQAQTPINSFQLSNRNDTIHLIKEFQPSKCLDYQGDDIKYNFYDVDAACILPLKIKKDDSETIATSRLYQHEVIVFDQGDGVSFFDVNAISEILGLKGNVLNAQYDGQTQIRFPINLTNTAGVGSLTLDVSSQDGVINRHKLQVDSEVTVYPRTDIGYPFGDRLTTPIIQDLAIDFEGQSYYFRQHLLINQYRGVLLAIVTEIDGEVVQVKLFKEIINHQTDRICDKSDLEFQFYPNPSFGEVNLLLANERLGVYTIEVYNIVGRPIFKELLSHDRTKTKHEITIPGIQKGTYLYSVKDPLGRRLYTRRLVIVDF